jgi:hypothetical protein
MATIGLCGDLEVYKWTSEDGQINFTDDFSNVPEKYRDQVKMKKYGLNKKAQENAVTESRENSDEESIIEESINEHRKEPKQELSDQEKEKIDKELRDTWANMKKALTRRKIK